MRRDRWRRAELVGVVAVANDGPLRADWHTTREFEVVAASCQLQVSVYEDHRPADPLYPSCMAVDVRCVRRAWWHRLRWHR